MDIFNKSETFVILPIIIPPSPYLTNPKSLMPLGVLYVAAYIESKGDKCIIIDLSGIDNYIEYTITKLKEIEFTHLGISATSGQIYYVLNIVKEIRKKFPNIKIIGGGPHFTHTHISNKKTPQRTQKFIKDFDYYFDSYVLGDGEFAIYEAIYSGKKVIDATSPLNSSYISSDKLETIPFPARHLIDINSYNYDLGCFSYKTTKAIHLIAQRGCPYGCRFCSSRVDRYSRIIRKPSIDRTIEEIEFLYKNYGYVDYTFYDDELNVHPGFDSFLNKFKNLQFKLGVELHFRAFLRSNLVDKNQMKKLKDAGMVVAAIGGESGSDHILKNINKKTTVEQNTRFVEYAKDLNIQSKCIMSIGHPGESEKTLEETYNWLQKVQLSDVNFTLISCLPSSFYYDYAHKTDSEIWTYTAPNSGDKLYSIDVDFHSKPNIFNGSEEYGMESTVFTDYLTQDQLVNWYIYLTKTFKKK